jgi:hypothetical protein
MQGSPPIRVVYNPMWPDAEEVSRILEVAPPRGWVPR